LSLQSEDVYIWDDAMSLIPKSGTAYLLKGKLESLKAIKNSDGIWWNNKSSSQRKANPKQYFYFVAIPVFGKTTDKPRQDQDKSANFKKIVIFDRRSSTFLVHYFGDDSPHLWKKRVRKASANLGT